jgi:hypothetical protein
MTSRLDDMHIKRLGRELSFQRKKVLATSLLSSQDSDDDKLLINEHVQGTLALKLPSMRVQKKSFSSLFNGNLTDEDLSDSKLTRNGSKRISRQLSGKDGEAESPKTRPVHRRASDNTKMRTSLHRSRNSGKDSDPESAAGRRVSDTSKIKGTSGSNLVPAEDSNFIAPIRRQRGSLTLFLKNSEKRKNGSRKPSIGDNNIEYNDEYAMTVAESVKKLSDYVQKSFSDVHDVFENTVAHNSSELMPIVEPLVSTISEKSEDSTEKELLLPSITLPSITSPSCKK